ncbi:WD40-repeat-containing domain protein [Gongronella butleri]|nr:WD40-repeat-containing domain protein [Gongronella butleri]
MTSLTRFDTGHEDLVHGVAYDYYGKRLATCSSDQRLKVWDFVESQDAGRWELNDAWKGHDASIMKAVWAPAEYGQIIASCSFDKSVKIWEEQPVESKNSQRRWAERFRLVESKGAVLDIAFSPIQGALRLATCSTEGIIRIYEALEPTNLSQWSQMEEFTIHMNKDSAPISVASPPVNQLVPTTSLLSQQQQLQQQQQEYQQQLLHQIQQQGGHASGALVAGTDAVATSAQSLPPHAASLHQQQQQQHANQASHAIHASSQQAMPPSSSYASNGDGHDELAVAASALPMAGSPAQDEHHAEHDATMATAGSHGTARPPHLGNLSPSNFSAMATRTPGSSSSGASSYTDASQVNTTPGMPPLVFPPNPLTTMLPASAPMETRQPLDLDCAYCIDWCPNRIATPMMIVGTGKEFGAKIFRHDGNNRWYPGEVLAGHTDQVNDVSWAPSMGRSYQLIATACRDHYVRIYKLTAAAPVRAGATAPRAKSSTTRGYTVELIAAFKQHDAEVWRVEWNITGTILSSSGADGTVRLWRTGYDRVWRQAAVINTEQKHRT